jgi:hypothetical protein
MLKNPGTVSRGIVNRWRREHFIPVRKAQFIRLLCEDQQLGALEREQFRQLCAVLEATIHHDYHRRLEELKDLYAPLNPDAVTCDVRLGTDAQRSQLIPELFEKFTELLERANYHHLSRAEVEQVAGTASEWGVRLKVDFEVFDRLEVFSRGDVVDRRTRRRWRRGFRLEEVDVPLYQRLVVIFHLRESKCPDPQADTQRVYIKLFKDIPSQDIDMLLPGTRFRMTLLDRGKILLPTLSGLALVALKIVKGALLLAFAGVYGMLAVLGLVGGTFGYGIKSFLGYLRTKDKYQLTLTRNLYYQNLDNNAGVLYRLLDEAEEQEFREAILAYALLRRKAGNEGWSEEQLDREAEAYLRGLLGFDVDFEIDDALAKLARSGSVVKTPAGRWLAVPLGDALIRFNETWDNQFHYHQPINQAAPGKSDVRP